MNYDNSMAQESYPLPPPADPLYDKLVATSSTTADDLEQATSLTALITYQKHLTLKVLPNIYATPSCDPPRGVCCGGDSGPCRTRLVTGGSRKIHLPRAPCVGMHTRDDIVHPWGDEAEISGWLHINPPRGRYGLGVWGKDQYALHCSSPLGALPSAPHT